MKRELELYLHIPFCVKKCLYCDFLSAPARGEEQQAYTAAVTREIKSYKEMAEAYAVSTVFLGGGTPSLLTEEQIEAVFTALHTVFSITAGAEITIEVNPGTVDRDKLITYQRLGINRLSIGLQSANDEELGRLGRIHTYQDFLNTYQTAREVGFTNINIDLMSSIPGQSGDDFSKTLERICRLNPEHISAYSLIIEEGTPYYNLYGEGQKEVEYLLPTEEEECRIDVITQQKLKSYGYERYEISNYAHPGYECRHNLGYWEGTEYLGIGLGASSLIKGVRFRHAAEMEAYVTEPEKRWEEEILDLQTQMEEFMFLGLRKTAGISKKDFQLRFGKAIEEIYGPLLVGLADQKLLMIEEDRIAFTESGRKVSNYVLAEFLL